MKSPRILLVFAPALILAGCSGVGSGPLAVESAATSVGAQSAADLERDWQAMRAASTGFGEGGLLVLDTAYEALREGRAEGRWQGVGLEDLWAHAIKEGTLLFNDPARRWGKTSAEETKDMIGQTTIGPWQITIQNVKTKYGPPHGVDSTWTNEEVLAWCREDPRRQVRMICDLIEENYTRYGRRNPHAIQCYFWLEPFVKGEIGQSDWDKSVLPTPPDGDWRKLTPEMKRDTGFYAAQLVCGTRTQPNGLLYWLAVTGKDQEIRDLLLAWRDAPAMEWDAAAAVARPVEGNAGLALTADHLKYLSNFPFEHMRVLSVMQSVGQ